MESLRKRAVEEVLRSEKSYLRHLEIIQEFFMQPIEDRKLLPQGDFAAIFGDLKSIIQVRVGARFCPDFSGACFRVSCRSGSLPCSIL